MLLHFLQFLMAATPAPTPALSGAASSIVNGATAACGSNCGTPDLTTVFVRVANTLTFVVGSASVLMVMYGGLRYTTSRGVAKDIETAKNTILYAIIGVVASIVAFALVSFVAKSI